MTRLLFAWIVLTGCGPAMWTQHHTVEAFASTQPCGQGPYVFDAEGFGSRWEEQWMMEVYSRHDLAMRWEASVDGEVVRSGSIGKTRLVPNPNGLDAINVANGVDNERCLRVFSPVEGEEASAERRLEAPAADPERPLESQPVQHSDLVPTEVPPDDLDRWLEETHRGRLRLQALLFENRNPDQVALPAGAALKFVLWSLEPNDLRDVVFVVTHRSRGPRSDEAFIAWLKEKQARQKVRRERQQRARTRRASTRGAARRAQRRTERNQRKYQRQMSRRNSPASGSVPLDSKPVRVPVDPGKPPPAVPELPGSPPRVGATWTPGYWHWQDEVWGWISGWWSGGENKPPATLPPAPEVSTPPPPPPSQPSVFIQGHWSVGIEGTVWVPGRWYVRLTVETGAD